MQPESIRSLLRQQPFEPFRIHVSSGEVYEIRHPELITASRFHVFVATPDIARPGDPEHDVLLSYLHIVKLEPGVAKRREAG